jgi:CelD/BcsL family acetyltransferase involved in cellulose biosynthesis
MRERLIDFGYISPGATCTQGDIKTMLNQRFDSIDFAQDMEPFIHNTAALNLWGSKFFRQITQGLTAV